MSELREDVCIVLNEREQIKSEMAAELSRQLASREIIHSRLKPSRNLSKIIAERLPRILILDYLIGDVGTALDLLMELGESRALSQIVVIVWTDEPNVSVAVDALKMGAQDYIELNRPNSLGKLIEAIGNNLAASKSSLSRKSAPKLIALELISDSEAMTQCLAQASSVASQAPEIVILEAQTGSGRTAVSHYIHANRAEAGQYIEIEIDYWAKPFEEIFGQPSNRLLVPLLSNASTIFLDHVEFSSTELLKFTQDWQERFKHNSTLTEGAMLIVGTTSHETAVCWSRLLKAPIVEVPGLELRGEDFFPLLQRFTTQIRSVSKSNNLEFSPLIINKISAMNWPGNVKQLRAVLAESLTTPIELIKSYKLTSDEITPEMSENESLLLSAILFAKNKWQKYNVLPNQLPDKLTAKIALERSEGNMQIAAARLGISVSQLRQQLSAAKPSSNNDLLPG